MRSFSARAAGAEEIVAWWKALLSTRRPRRDRNGEAFRYDKKRVRPCGHLTANMASRLLWALRSSMAPRSREDRRDELTGEAKANFKGSVDAGRAARSCKGIDGRE